MVRSMTGFGVGTEHGDGLTATVELSSVNHRHSQVKVRVPDPLTSCENDIQDRIKGSIERGRVTARVEINYDDPAEELIVDRSQARRYAGLLREVKDAAELEEPIRLAHLLEFPDLFRSSLTDEDQRERAWSAVEGALESAIAQLEESRREEGRELSEDLAARVDAIEEYLDEVVDLAPQRVDALQERLRDRLDELLEDQRIDADRLEQEIAVQADKIDVTEECVRLRSHLKFFREALDQEEAAGRRLKFLTQEMHREINTIGAKANDAAISQHAVGMKEELEKIREQIENVE